MTVWQHSRDRHIPTCDADDVLCWRGVPRNIYDGVVLSLPCSLVLITLVIVALLMAVSRSGAWLTAGLTGGMLAAASYVFPLFGTDGISLYIFMVTGTEQPRTEVPCL